MAKQLSKKVAVRYIGQKPEQEDTVSGARAITATGREVDRDAPLFWQANAKPLFVTVEQAARLLFYPSMWEDARTEDDKAKQPIKAVPPIDHRYLDQTEEEIAEGRDVMPFVNINSLDKKGLVHFAGTYLHKRLDADDTLPALRDQVNRAVEGMRFEWA